MRKKDAGKLLLQGNALDYNGHKLHVHEDVPASAVKKITKTEASSSTMFAPRGVSRPRAGIGSTKKATAVAATPGDVSKGVGSGKSQDDFRKLL